jgi:hypothetical protein
MKFFRLFLFFVILVSILLILTEVSIAQNIGPGDPGCDPLDPDCPIDGGISLLIAAGIGLGAKKTYNDRKKATQQKEG